MPVYPKCTHPKRSRPSDPRPLPLTPPLDLGQGPTGYSIRIAVLPGTPCKFCGTTSGAGAVGHFFDDPICDRCCATHCLDLGMVLALIDVMRCHAILKAENSEAARARQGKVDTFLQIFETMVSHWGPPRVFDLNVGGPFS